MVKLTFIDNKIMMWIINENFKVYYVYYYIMVYVKMTLDKVSKGSNFFLLNLQ